MSRKEQVVMSRVMTWRTLESEYERFRQLAAAQGLTVSDLTRHALEEYCEKLSQSRSQAA